MKQHSIVIVFALAALALSGCTPNNKRIPISKTLKGGGERTRVAEHADQKLAPFSEGDCLNLKDLTATLNQTGEAFLLYTSNIDLGVSTDKTRKDFTTLGDNILRGQAIKESSVKLLSKGTKDLLSGATLGGYLAVKAQDACESVTFSTASGGETLWSVQDKAAGVLILSQAASGEVRKYSFNNNGEISVTAYSPDNTKKDCAGNALSLFRREAMTIAWDGRLGDGLNLSVSFVKAVASHLKLPPAFDLSEAEKKSDDGRLEVAQGLSVPQAQYELFKTVIEDGAFAGIECAK